MYLVWIDLVNTISFKLSNAFYLDQGLYCHIMARIKLKTRTHLVVSQSNYIWVCLVYCTCSFILTQILIKKKNPHSKQ